MPPHHWTKLPFAYLLVAGLGLGVCGVSGRALEVPYRAGVDLVTLDVLVRSPGGRIVPSLPAEEFIILENGRPQTLSFMEAAERIPIRLVLLIDRSASMVGPKMQQALKVARRMVGRLRPHDSLEVLAFSKRTTRLVGFDDGPAARLAGLSALSAEGVTALYDGLLVAAGDVQRARGDAPRYVRDAVVVLSDGDDTASLNDFDDVLQVLRRTGALVYTVTLRPGERRAGVTAAWPMSKVAHDTGARAVSVRDLTDLPALYDDIDAEIRQMYRLGYVSTDTNRNGEWRSVSVRTRTPELRVRTRTGYYAPRS